MQNNIQEREPEKTIREILQPYILRWKFILAGVIVCLIVAFLFLRYSTTEYKTTSKILIRDENRGQSAADLNIFKDLGVGGGSGNVDNEIEILKSRTLIKHVSDSLNLDVAYFAEGRVKRSELYNESPIKFNVYNYNDQDAYMRVDLTADGKFSIIADKDDFRAVVSANQKFETPYGIGEIKLATGDSSYPVWVELSSYMDKYRNNQISFLTVSKTSGVVDISTISSTPEKSEDIINTIVRFYNMRAINDKRWVTEQTIFFIDDRLESISSDLEKIERDVERYKRDYQLTDLEAEAGLYLSSGSEYERRIAEMELQNVILASIKEYVVEDENKYHAIPTNLGITDDALSSLIEQYNSMQLMRRETTVGMTEENPMRAETDRQLVSLRNDILNGIRSAESNYSATINNLRDKEDSYNSRIRTLSTNEREYRSLIRQREITETTFLYLLQKKEESAISLSIVTPDAKIIDYAYTLKKPVKPNKSTILIISLLAGLLIPLLIIYIKELLNNKVKTKEDLEKLVKSPLAGVIPDQPKGSDIVIQEDDRSGVVEMYRLLSTNLEFMMTDKNEKIIMVTSSVPSEGKSSFSVNLALTWATVGKKVLLVDLDIRNSRMDTIFDINGAKGMSSFLADNTVKVNDVLLPSRIQQNLDVALAGIFPPNPVQLLLNKRLDEFFSEVRGLYDIIVVDTPPVMMVTDAILINRLADVTVYVTRSGITHKQYLKVAEDLSRENKLKGLSYVMKGVGSGKGYGYGYGYGYDARNKKGKRKYKKKKK